MSDRIVEPGSDVASEPARETSAGVLGVAFGLGLIGLLVLVVAAQRSNEVDARALVGSSFELGELPFELALVEAAEIATGERVAVLEAPDVVEPPRAETADDTGATDDDYDWTTLEEGESGTPPVQVFLVWYPARSGAAAIRRQFENRRWQDLSEFEAEGGRLMTDQGVVDWAGYDADLVVERELEPGGTFRDWVRVNLSLPDRACVLLARWGRGKPASVEHVDALLEALQPKVPSERTDEEDDDAGG